MPLMKHLTNQGCRKYWERANTLIVPGLPLHKRKDGSAQWIYRYSPHKHFIYKILYAFYYRPLKKQSLKQDKRL